VSVVEAQPGKVDWVKVSQGLQPLGRFTRQDMLQFLVELIASKDMSGDYDYFYYEHHPVGAENTGGSSDWTVEEYNQVLNAVEPLAVDIFDQGRVGIYWLAGAGLKFMLTQGR
jgi:hypothetical protein